MGSESDVGVFGKELLHKRCLPVVKLQSLELRRRGRPVMMPQGRINTDSGVGEETVVPGSLGVYLKSFTH